MRLLNTAWSRGTMPEAPGTQFLSVGAGRAGARLDWKRELTQLTGRLHAGAIIAFADEAPTAAAIVVRAETVPPAGRAVTSPMWATNPSAELRPEVFPLTLQLSVNLIGNTDRGSLTAEAEIVHRGRSTLVIEVRVVDDRQRLIAKLVATQLAPVASTVTAPAARPER